MESSSTLLWWEQGKFKNHYLETFWFALKRNHVISIVFNGIASNFKPFFCSFSIKMSENNFNKTTLIKQLY